MNLASTLRKIIASTFLSSAAVAQAQKTPAEVTDCMGTIPASTKAVCDDALAAAQPTWLHMRDGKAINAYRFSATNPAMRINVDPTRDQLIFSSKDSHLESVDQKAHPRSYKLLNGANDAAQPTIGGEDWKIVGNGMTGYGYTRSGASVPNGVIARLVYTRPSDKKEICWYLTTEIGVQKSAPIRAPLKAPSPSPIAKPDSAPTPAADSGLKNIPALNESAWRIGVSPTLTYEALNAHTTPEADQALNGGKTSASSHRGLLAYGIAADVRGAPNNNILLIANAGFEGVRGGKDVKGSESVAETHPDMSGTRFNANGTLYATAKNGFGLALGSHWRAMNGDKVTGETEQSVTMSPLGISIAPAFRWDNSGVRLGYKMDDFGSKAPQHANRIHSVFAGYDRVLGNPNTKNLEWNGSAAVSYGRDRDKLAGIGTTMYAADASVMARWRNGLRAQLSAGVEQMNSTRQSTAARSTLGIGYSFR